MERHEETLHKVLEDIAVIQEYEDCEIEIKPVSSGGANYSSILYTATISAPRKETLHLFAKIIVIANKYHFVVDLEKYVYVYLAKYFEKIQNRYGIPDKDRLVLAKYFDCDPILRNDIIVLENLAIKGFGTYDRMRSVDWPYASKAIEVLAKYHALTISFIEENPDEYARISTRYTDEMEEGYNDMQKMLPKQLASALKVTNEENRKKLEKFFQNESNCTFLKFKTVKRRAAFVHGDYRPSNLMHKIDKDGTIHLIPMDFQTVQFGCMTTDLIYFIFTSTDGAFRARYYRQLLEHYYTQLRRALRALRLDPDKLYPRDDFDYELKETLPFGLLCAVLLLPVITVEEKSAPDVSEDVFDTISNIKISKLYSERMNGIVDDFVRWGVL